MQARLVCFPSKNDEIVAFHQKMTMELTLSAQTMKWPLLEKLHKLLNLNGKGSAIPIQPGMAREMLTPPISVQDKCACPSLLPPDWKRDIISAFPSLFCICRMSESEENKPTGVLKDRWIYLVLAGWFHAILVILLIIMDVPLFVEQAGF